MEAGAGPAGLEGLASFGRGREPLEGSRPFLVTGCAPAERGKSEEALLTPQHAGRICQIDDTNATSVCAEAVARHLLPRCHTQPPWPRGSGHGKIKDMAPLTFRDSNADELRAFDDTCARLNGFEPHLDFEWVDGFLTALAASWQLPPLEQWLPALCGDAFDRAFADPPAAAAALQALKARLAVLRDQLDPEALLDHPETLFLNPLLAEPQDADDMPPGAWWAEGFLAAVGAFPALWPAPDPAADADWARYHAELWQAIQALRLPATATSRADAGVAIDAPVGAGCDPATAAAQPGEPSGEDPGRELAMAAALAAVQDFRIFWVDSAPGVSTRRVQQQPGRNDPCPCGSGRKFKKCHGAAGAEAKGPPR